MTTLSEKTTLSESARGSKGGIPGRGAVPWLTIVPLAVVMAYADGFWMTSLRGSVGSIERTQGPFLAWLQESTLVLPVFIFAVLGALMLALRWFGPVVRTTRKVLSTTLMVVAAGTVVGIAELAASSAYDYHLQLTQLMHMGSTRPGTAATILALQQQATLNLQVHSVLYGAGILLVTNLLLVGWVVALRGGRLDVKGTGRRTPSVLPQT